MTTYLIKVYHSFSKGKIALARFLDDLSKTMTGTLTLGLHYVKGELVYSLSTKNENYPTFESQFYTHFNDFQIIPNDKSILDLDPEKSAIGKLSLQNSWFFPFKLPAEDNSSFVFNLFRTFENFDVINDKVALFITLDPIKAESTLFFLKASLQYLRFKLKLVLNFFKYIFNFKIQKDRKSEGRQYFKQKLQKSLYQTRVSIIVQSTTKETAKAKLKSIFTNFKMFENYPLNLFKLTTEYPTDGGSLEWAGRSKKYPMSTEEISCFFQFPQNPSSETSLLTVKAKKLTLPIGVPTFEYTINDQNEVLPKAHPHDVSIIGVSDYRSIRVPVGMYDEDRLRHLYVV
ncbi:MAG: hypothetical protein Q8O99_03160 [bacterium]|nr:hypothetical protein [bacterium]